ncbi:MAG: biopolymer transporter ExbD [Deltaproteobacteria bacterium]|nr:biopolymer transporter ExbD [Deltaproteobacteria bacterium]MBW2722925.1 biopolymer transporter ExbD [Deltaproteobacteria bacterium]
MARRHHYRRRSKQPADLDMTTFLNLMVVLVPFLLITAVFSRITIIELSLPTSEGASAPVEPSYRIEVIVRSTGLELTDGTSVIARMPMVDDEYDLAKLSEHVLSLKRDHPDDNDASVLLEPDIEYDHLIQVMDVLRSKELPGTDGREPMRLALFADVSIGDAP